MSKKANRDRMRASRIVLRAFGSRPDLPSGKDVVDGLRLHTAMEKPTVQPNEWIKHLPVGHNPFLIDVQPDEGEPVRFEFIEPVETYVHPVLDADGNVIPGDV